MALNIESMTIPSDAIAELRARIRGPVFTPADEVTTKPAASGTP
jgi:hypothetical protein